jgi:hypothetical protein
MYCEGSETDEADKMNRFVESCPSLILTEGFEISGYPTAFWVTSSKETHDEITACRYIPLYYQGA